MTWWPKAQTKAHRCSTMPSRTCSKPRTDTQLCQCQPAKCFYVSCHRNKTSPSRVLTAKSSPLKVSNNITALELQTSRRPFLSSPSHDGIKFPRPERTQHRTSFGGGSDECRRYSSRRLYISRFTTTGFIRSLITTKQDTCSHVLIRWRRPSLKASPYVFNSQAL